MWRRFDRVLMCSDVDAAQARARSPAASVDVVPNCVDTRRYRPSRAPTNGSRLIYLGHMGWWPNEDAVMHFVTDIYPTIKIRLPDVTFLIVGQAPSAEVSALATGDASITVTGAVDDVIPYLHQSAVSVVPLRIASGSRLKILEALAAETAVVSTSTGCEGLNTTHNEHIMICDEPVQFARAVITLIEDPTMRSRLEASGRALVTTQYDWAAVGRRAVDSVRAAIES